MSSKCRGSEQCYNGGCRSEACRLAAAEGRRERRRLAREAVGEPDVVDTDRTNVVSMPIDNASISVNAETSVVAGVLAEVSTLESPRPDLVAVALALAEAMDNPKATTSKPPAARVLVSVLEKLHATASKRQTTLVVRPMISKTAALVDVNDFWPALDVRRRTPQVPRGPSRPNRDRSVNQRLAGPHPRL
jgi:hypothetical protein